MNLFLGWILIGIGVYLGCMASRYYMLKGASIFEVLKGLAFGIVTWPLALICMAWTVHREHVDD